MALLLIALLQTIPPLPDSSGWGVHVLAIARAPDSAIWVGTYGQGNGVVVHSGPAERGALTVAIRHDRRLPVTPGRGPGARHPYFLYSVYYHNSKLLVKVGQRVKAGDVIALVGTYGPRNHSDPVYQEHFGISDVPPGEYVLGVEIGGKRVFRRVKVEAGKLTWVEFRPIADSR